MATVQFVLGKRTNQEILRYGSEMLRESRLQSLDVFNEMVCAKNVKMKEIKNDHIREWNRVHEGQNDSDNYTGHQNEAIETSQAIRVCVYICMYICMPACVVYMCVPRHTYTRMYVLCLYSHNSSEKRYIPVLQMEELRIIE